MRKICLQYLIIIFSVCFSCSKDSGQSLKKDLDDTSPSLSFSIEDIDTSSNDPILLSGQIEIKIEATDLSGISIVEAFIDNQKIGEDASAPFNISVDLSSYNSATGKNNYDLNAILKIIATDLAGNKTVLEKDIIIVTRKLLLTINIPDGLLNPNLQDVFVFASDMDGNYLESTIEPISSVTRSINIYAPENFDLSEEFMITFMGGLAQGLGISYSYATTYQNLMAEKPGEINLKVPERFRVLEDKILPAVNFGDNIFPTGDGIDYNTNLYRAEEEWLCEILRPETTNDRTTDKIYLSYNLNSNPTNYYYIFIDRPLPENFQLNANSFENTNSKMGSISYLNFDSGPSSNDYVKIYGFESEADLELYNFHTISSQQLFDTTPSVYSYNDSFFQYSHELHLGNFYTKGLGLPLEEYILPIWTLNPTIENNRIILNKSGEGHSTGRIQLREENANDVYDWRILFNSELMDSVNIPQVPQEIGNTVFSSRYDTKSFKIRQTEISRYEGIDSYEDYIMEIIRENRNVEIYSNRKETKFKSNPDVYFQFKDLIFD